MADEPAEKGLDTSEAGKLGGKARAKALSKTQRSEIARQAALSRWSKEGYAVRRATHGSAEHPLRIGSVELECYVLDDGTRVLTQGGFLTALGRHKKARIRRDVEDHTPPILHGESIKPFISKEILEKSKPIAFRTPAGGWAHGYRADLLPEVCEVFLEARAKNALPHTQAHVAKQAEIIVRALAHVGIIALIDEATGYQQDRARDALSKILEAFVAKELQKWVSTFRLDYYEEMFRLWEIPYDPKKPTMKRPQFFGALTNNIVYRRLAPGVLQELRKRNPANESGQRSAKHFQHLTTEIGHPRLKEHLAAVTALMRASRNKEQFMKMLDAALPKYKEAPLFDASSAVPDAPD